MRSLTMPWSHFCLVEYHNETGPGRNLKLNYSQWIITLLGYRSLNPKLQSFDINCSVAISHDWQYPANGIIKHSVSRKLFVWQERYKSYIALVFLRLETLGLPPGKPHKVIPAPEPAAGVIRYQLPQMLWVQERCSKSRISQHWSSS